MSKSISALPAPENLAGASYAARNASYWKRNLAVATFGSFTTLVSLSMLLPFLPLYVEQLGITAQAEIVQWSGAAFGVTFLATAITAPLWGRLADRFGRKPMLVRAAVGMAIVMSMIGLAHNVYELVALRFAAGLIGGYASAATVMIGTQAPPDRAGWALGVLSSGALVGNLVGPLVGGLLPNLIGIRGTFFAGGAVIAVAALLTILVVREDFQRPAKRTDGLPADTGVRQHTSRLPLIALLVTATMVLLSNMSIEPIITIYIGQLGVPHSQLASTAGIVMASSAFGSVMTASRLGALADRIGAWKVIIGCLVATAIVMVPQAFVTNWWSLAILRGLMGMTLAGLLPAIGKLVRQAVKEHQSGRMLGYLQSAQFAGQVIGPLIGGQIGVHFGMRSVFFATSAVLLGCAAFDRWVKAQ
ncbi:MFS transporter (plasmid) [Cupriavidus sp. KK10]|nr:MFS transporter [Cupriavidus sp. KK10]QUN32452.1 MFS transporter [Cupriavidus sp. KK10]